MEDEIFMQWLITPLYPLHFSTTPRSNNIFKRKVLNSMKLFFFLLDFTGFNGITDMMAGFG